MFQAFKGVKELAAKNVDDFTESDVRAWVCRSPCAFRRSDRLNYTHRLARRSIPLRSFPFPQGLQVLDSFRDFAKRGVQAMAMVANPEKYVDFMGKYADLAGDELAPANAREGKMKELLGALQAGDRAAAREFHDMVAGDIWGDGALALALGRLAARRCAVGGS
jgi:hypothetical protein